MCFFVDQILLIFLPPQYIRWKKSFTIKRVKGLQLFGAIVIRYSSKKIVRNHLKSKVM